MFTGIIEELGTVKSLHKTGLIARLQVFAPKIAQEAELGQSICVNGVCLTCVQTQGSLLSFEIMQETLKRTNLGLLRPADKVNLERALRVNGRYCGHFVTGHIDDIGMISRRQRKGGDVIIFVKSPLQLLHYIVLKGSVALDGVSLTVSAQEDAAFGVNLIPYTLNNTTLGLRKEKDLVNIECDIIAKYIDKFLSQNRQSHPPNITLSFLKAHGFIS